MIPIIYYHSVGPIYPNWSHNFLTLELTSFHNQLKYFVKHYRSISLKEYHEIRIGIKEPAKNSLVITLDDGYLDNWIWAFPLLKKYGLKATIFISPEFVDTRSIVRPNLENVWQGDANYEDLYLTGFLSWEEMRLMENSGLISIESHTMSHTKYVVSDKLEGFHNGSDESLYVTGNLYKDRKPYYINDSSFSKLLPYGYPLFEEASSVIARKIDINPEFIEECVRSLNDYDFNYYSFETAYRHVEKLYKDFKINKNLIISHETEEDYILRLRYEICESKKIIEEKLNKEVEFLCWPHGDNNDFSHRIALEAGYRATMWGNMKPNSDDPQRIPARIGANTYRSRGSRMLGLLRTKFKIKCFQKKFPYYQIHELYYKLRY